MFVFAKYVLGIDDGKLFGRGPDEVPTGVDKRMGVDQVLYFFEQEFERHEGFVDYEGDGPITKDNSKRKAELEDPKMSSKAAMNRAMGLDIDGKELDEDGEETPKIVELCPIECSPGDAQSNVYGSSKSSSSLSNVYASSNSVGNNSTVKNSSSMNMSLNNTINPNDDKGPRLPTDGSKDTQAELEKLRVAYYNAVNGAEFNSNLLFDMIDGRNGYIKSKKQSKLAAEKIKKNIERLDLINSRIAEIALNKLISTQYFVDDFTMLRFIMDISVECGMIWDNLKEEAEILMLWFRQDPSIEKDPNLHTNSKVHSLTNLSDFFTFQLEEEYKIDINSDNPQVRKLIEKQKVSRAKFIMVLELFLQNNKDTLSSILCSDQILDVFFCLFRCAKMLGKRYKDYSQSISLHLEHLKLDIGDRKQKRNRKERERKELLIELQPFINRIKMRRFLVKGLDDQKDKTGSDDDGHGGSAEGTSVEGTYYASAEGTYHKTAKSTFGGSSSVTSDSHSAFSSSSMTGAESSTMRKRRYYTDAEISSILRNE